MEKQEKQQEQWIKPEVGDADPQPYGEWSVLQIERKVPAQYFLWYPHKEVAMKKRSDFVIAASA